KIINSIPFLLDLVNEKYHCPDVERPISLLEYYTEYTKPSLLSTVKKYTIGLPGLIIGALKGKEDEISGMDQAIFITLTEEQQLVIKAISDHISVEYNEKEGYVDLTATMNDAVLAAELAQKSQDLLQDYITKYKVAKAKDQLVFVKGRLKEKEADFNAAQNELATYRDRNQNVRSAVALTEMERLQTKYNLTFSIYSELAKQYETALIKVKENTPVLTVIEPVQLPHEPSAPNKPLIVIIWAFLGGIISIGIVFGRKFLSSVKEDWDSYDTSESEYS
ncbi:MAG: GNVR domain-containing protein, partial [Mangrovibacterium sp.]